MPLGSGVTFLAGIATVLTIVGAYLYQKKKKEILPRTWEEVGIVKKLNLYPLKSGHKVELIRAECTNSGLKQTEEDEKVFQLRDRFLVVYTQKEHEFRTARTYPKLLLIDVAVHDQRHLAIDAPTMRTLYVKIPGEEKTNSTAIKFQAGEKVNVIDCGDEAALWMSRYILEKDSGLRLGYNNGNQESDGNNIQTGLMDYYKQLSSSIAGAYSDENSVLLVNQTSVNDLNSHLGDSTVTVDNFKPNIVVDGQSLEPYSEELWDWIRIGDVVFKNMNETIRNHDIPSKQQNGNSLVNGGQRKSLEHYSLTNGSKDLPVIGINLHVREKGNISVGDKVFISKTI